MNKKIGIIALALMLTTIGGGCAAPMLQTNQEVQQVDEKPRDYTVEVRGLTLKYVLIDSASEIYQFQTEFKDKKENYMQDPDTKKHYEWMMATYEDMSQEIKDSLAMIMTKAHPWGIMNVTSALGDEASVEEIIECLVTSKQLPYNQEEKEQLNLFFTTYYEKYLKEYLEINAPLFEKKAQKLNEAIKQQDSDIMTFMEQQSGLQFEEKKKPVFYYTLRLIGAMGFDQPGVKISLIQRNVEDINDLFSTPFHEFSHELFGQFTDKSSFKKVANRLKKKDKDFAQIWETRYQQHYSWVGWCEENVVEGFATYLNEKYYGRTATMGIYTYDLAFYNYLKEINFDPQKMSLEEASVEFYEQVLDNFNKTN